MPSTPTAEWIPNAGIQLTSWLNWNRSPCGANWVTIAIVSARVSSDTPRAACLMRLTFAVGTDATTPAPTSGTAPITVNQGKVIAASALDQQKGGQDNDNATEHRQRVRPDEPALEPTEPARCATDERCEAVHEAIDPAVVEEHQEPSQVLARPHEHRLVESITQEISPRSNGERTADRSDGRHRPTRVHEPGARDTEKHDTRSGQADHADRLEGKIVGLRYRGGEELRQSATQDEHVTAANRSDRQDPHRHGHRPRRLVRMRAFGPPLVAEERHHHDPRHVERSQPSCGERATAEDRT